MTRPNSSAPIAAAVPVTGNQAVDAFLKREAELFRKPLPSTNQTLNSVTTSPQIAAMKEYLEAFIAGAFNSYIWNEKNKRYEPKPVALTTIDRIFNEYGISKTIGEGLYLAERSKEMKEAALKELGDEESFLTATPEQRAEVIKKIADEFQAREIAEGRRIYQERNSSPFLPKEDEELNDVQRDELIKLAREVLETKIVSLKLPKLAALLSSVPDTTVLNTALLKAISPTELFDRASQYYASLRMDQPATTRKALEARMGVWMAEMISCTLLYVQALVQDDQVAAAALTAIHTMPDQVINKEDKAALVTASPIAAITKIISTYFDGSSVEKLTQEVVLNKLVSSLMLAFSNVMLETIPHVNNPFYSYFSHLFTKIGNIAYNDVQLPEKYQSNPFGLWQYVAFLLANFDDVDHLSELDKKNIETFKKGFLFLVRSETRGETDHTNLLAFKVSEILQEPNFVIETLYNELSLADRLFLPNEYQSFISEIFYSVKASIPLNILIAKFYSLTLSEKQKALYAKTMAALYFAAGTASVNAPQLQLEVLENIPQQAKKDVYRALSRLSVEDYLVYKHADRLGIESAQQKFFALTSDQKAERNIAAAYQILALSEAADAYDKRTDVSAELKQQANEAVYAIIKNLQQQAKLRGKHGLRGQSSQFVKLLDAVDLGDLTDKAVEMVERKIQFPAGFDLTAYNAIGDENKRQNTWYRQFFKKLNNWTAQNPWTTTTIVLSSILTGLAVAALIISLVSPAAIVSLPLLGISFAAGVLFIPSVATAGGALLIGVASIVLNTRFTAAAKIQRAGLDKQVVPPAEEASSSTTSQHAAFGEEPSSSSRPEIAVSELAKRQRSRSYSEGGTTDPTMPEAGRLRGFSIDSADKRSFSPGHGRRFSDPGVAGYGPTAVPVVPPKRDQLPSIVNNPISQEGVVAPKEGVVVGPSQRR